MKPKHKPIIMNTKTAYLNIGSPVNTIRVTEIKDRVKDFLGKAIYNAIGTKVGTVTEIEYNDVFDTVEITGKITDDATKDRMFSGVMLQATDFTIEDPDHKIPWMPKPAKPSKHNNCGVPDKLECPQCGERFHPFCPRCKFNYGSDLCFRCIPGYRVTFVSILHKQY